MKKDNRIVYTYKAIEVNGIKQYFDGKGNPGTKELKVYRYYGDINQSGEALQNFAIDNGYDTVITNFQTY